MSIWTSSNVNKFKDTLIKGTIDISGNIFMENNSNIYANNIDVNSMNGTMYIGQSATNIYLGNSVENTKIYFDGALNYITKNNLNISDTIISLNNGSGSGSGYNCGFQIQEGIDISSNPIYTGYIKTSIDRNSFLIKPPNGNEYNIATSNDINNLTNGNNNFSGKINFNDEILVNNNICDAGNAGIAGNLLIGNNLTVAQNITSNNLTVNQNINCNSLNCNNSLYYKGQSAGSIVTNSNLNIPLINSIQNTTTTYTNLNLQNILLTTGNNCYVFLNPSYKLVFYNNNNILRIIDNTTNTTILYQSITFNLNFLCTKIIVQYNNITI